MKVGLVGLGRMGAAIAQRLNERGCEIVAWDRNPKAREAQAKRGLRIVNNPHAVANFSKLWANFREPGPRQVEFAVTDTIQDLGGRAPKRFDEFVIEQQAGFAA